MYWEATAWCKAANGSQGCIRLELQNASTHFICDNPAPADSNWHFIAITWSLADQTSRTYFDGVLQPWTCTGLTSAIGTPNQNLNIGRDQNNGDYFDGDIADVRIYNRALSAAEVQALYNDGR